MYASLRTVPTELMAVSSQPPYERLLPILEHCYKEWQVYGLIPLPFWGPAASSLALVQRNTHKLIYWQFTYHRNVQWYLCISQASIVLCEWGEDSGFSLFLTLGYPLTPTDFKPKAQNFFKRHDNAISFWWVKRVIPFDLYVMTHILSAPYPAVPYQGDNRSFEGEAKYSLYA